MDKINKLEEQDEPQAPSETPEAVIEIMFIQEYLQERGLRMKDLCALPSEEARNLMKGACSYASFKLAEMNSKAGLRREMKGKKNF